MGTFGDEVGGVSFVKGFFAVGECGVDRLAWQSKTDKNLFTCFIALRLVIGRYATPVMGESGDGEGDGVGLFLFGT